MSGYRVGIDVGGTFTDVLCVTPAGDVVLDKTPTTPDDQSVGVMTGLDLIAARLGTDRAALLGELDVLVHGTTTADNTMIEMNGAAVGLLVTEGHRDEIELRRCHKEQIWDPSYPGPEPIARRRARIPIPQRTGADGSQLKALDEDAVRHGIRRLRALGCTSIAVMYLFSFVDSSDERRTAEIIREEYPDVEHVTLSHEVMPRGPEFERVSTTLVNAYVAPTIARYVERLAQSLRSAGYAGPLLIMQSTGGVMPPDYVSRRAVSVLASGPTGGVMGAAHTASESATGDFVAVDMGGTSYDLALVRDGRPEIRTDWNWRYRYYLGMPMVDVRSVGAGGGSIARVRAGSLLVGPASAGSTPGPACYGRGGDRPTVTDADLVLGYLPAHGFAGGRMELDVDAARDAIARDVAEPLGIDVDTAAAGIRRIVDNNMANATRKVLAGHGADPRDLAMIAYGGNGPVHAASIAAELGTDRVVVPRAAPAFSALGVLVADYALDLVRSYVAPLAQVSVERIRDLATELAGEVDKELEATDLDPAAVTRSLSLQMCYPGQNFDMSVPAPEAAELAEEQLLDLAARFHDRHEADRGFSFRSQAPIVRGIRLEVRGATPKPSPSPLPQAETAPEPVGERLVRWEQHAVPTPVFDGTQLGAGAVINGPALLDEPFTVVAVPPGSRATLDEGTSYTITR